MAQLGLVPIRADGAPCDDAEQQTGVPEGLGSAYTELYRQRGYVPPWTGYLAVRDGQYVGTCGFKGPPAGERVEIAYFTFPAWEGQGVATEMARQLVALARETDPGLTITARTMPREGASTAILRKLEFICAGTVQDPEDGPVWEWVLAAGEGVQ